MKKTLRTLFSVIFLLSNLFFSFGSSKSYAAEQLDASQFVSNVTLADANGPIGINKIRDSSSIHVTYNLAISNGNTIDPTQPYTMALPKELSYETTTPIRIDNGSGVHLGDVTINNGIISIQFSPDITSFENLKINFNFWAALNKNQLNYETGNDLLFPTQNYPNNTIHVNFSKTSSGGGSGTSAIAKTLNYDDTDPTIVNWTITVNNGGYPIDNASIQDIMENNQDFIAGSMTVAYRNWRKTTIYTEKTDPIISQQADGRQSFSLSFGKLTSTQEENNTATTSLVIHYKTKLLNNALNNQYHNNVSSYDSNELIDSAQSTAVYRGQGGGGEGDQVMTISGKKIWEDQDNTFQTRPETVTIALLRDGETYRQTTISEGQDGDWSYSFSTVPKYDSSGKAYTYSVQELNVPEGYSSEVNGTDITNHYPARTTEISGQKIWRDQDNQDGKRPSAITVNLLANGILQESQVVTSQNDWKYQFAQQPMYSNGKEISYSVSENAVPGYTAAIEGTTIINTHTPEVRSITVQKNWDDQENQDGLRSEHVQAVLLANGKKVNEAALDEASQWTHTWDELPKYENGQAINYTVEEQTTIPGYTTNISKQNEDTFIITNTHQPLQTTVKGRKTWRDNNNRAGKRPDNITIQLLANGLPVTSKQVSSSDNWSYEFTALPKNQKGKPIVYSIVEESVPGYISQVQGYDLINTYSQETTIPSINVTQKWNDDNNKNKDRPDSVKVQLYDGNKKHGNPVVLNDNNHWTHSWKNLPKQDLNGNNINYTVKAIDVPKNYHSTVIEQAPYDFVITNTYQNTVGNESSQSVSKIYPKTGENNSEILLVIGTILAFGTIIGYLLQIKLLKNKQK